MRLLKQGFIPSFKKEMNEIFRCHKKSYNNLQKCIETVEDMENSEWEMEWMEQRKNASYWRRQYHQWGNLKLRYGLAIEKVGEDAMSYTV